MELQTRTTKEFITIKVDEIECTIYRDRKEELNRTIDNLLSVVNDLCYYTDKSINEHVNDLF